MTITKNITNVQEFENFYSQAKIKEPQVEYLTIVNVAVDKKKLDELRQLLPNLKELKYEKPTTANDYSLDTESEEEEDDDDHGACKCHRHDRYE